MSKKFFFFGCVPRWQQETIDHMTNIGIDYDATVYFASTAYEITGIELWEALDTMVVDTKDLFGLTPRVTSLDTFFEFWYPRIGGTADRHKYDLVRGTAGTFSGGWTHDGSGAEPNGSNGYFDPSVVCTDFTRSDCGMGFWSKTDRNSGAAEADYGSTGGSGGEFLSYTRLSNLYFTRLNDNGINSSTANTNSIGYHSMSRATGSAYRVFRNGSLLTTHSTADTNFSARPIIEGAQNSTGGTGISATQYSPRKRTHWIGHKNMTDGQMSSFYTILSTFETALGR